MNTKLVIFDLDGTLIDAFEDIAVAANFIRSINSLSPLTVLQVKQFVGHGARRLISGILATDDETVIEENHAALVQFYKTVTDTRARVYDGVLETVTQLRELGIKTAIATNKPDVVTRKVLKDLKIKQHFDFIRGEASGIPRKPAPDVLHFLMANAQAEPHETLMVGDSYVDIRCARAAKTLVAGVTYGQYNRAEMEEYAPDYIIDCITEILNIVKS